MIAEVKNDTKVKQIVIRVDNHSYEKIREFAEIEHRGLGEFVRHATLDYIENFGRMRYFLDERR